MPTIYKRGDAYRVQFIHKNRRRQKQFKRLKDAKTFITRLSTTSLPDMSRVTVQDAAREWLSACARGIDGRPPLEPETRKTYKGYVENWIIPLVGRQTLGAITQAKVRDFREEVLVSGIERITAKKIVGAFKSVLSYATLTGELTANPGAGVTVRLGSRQIEKVQVFELDTVKALLEVARELSVDADLRVANAWVVYYPMVSLLANTGIRISEMRGLPRSAVNTEDRWIAIRQRADKAGKIGLVKSAAARRTIFIPETLNELLQGQLARHSHDLVFPSKTGKPLDAGNIGERMWRPLLEKAGVPHRGIHILRHFYASRLIAMGESVKEVACALGHADEAFTLATYGHLFNDRDNLERRKQRAEKVIASIPVADL